MQNGHESCDFILSWSFILLPFLWIVTSAFAINSPSPFVLSQARRQLPGRTACKNEHDWDWRIDTSSAGTASRLVLGSRSHSFPFWDERPIQRRQRSRERS